MLKEIEGIKEKIKIYNQKYGDSFKDFEISILESDDENMNWKDYFEWKSLLNNKRILTREIRIIENRGKEIDTENGV